MGVGAFCGICAAAISLAEGAIGCQGDLRCSIGAVAGAFAGGAVLRGMRGSQGLGVFGHMGAGALAGTAEEATFQLVAGDFDPGRIVLSGAGGAAGGGLAHRIRPRAGAAASKDAPSRAIELHPFSGGASHITTTRNLERFPGSTTFGGPDGLYVAPTRQIDDLLASGATRSQIEAALGLNKGSLRGGKLVRIDIADPFARGLRLPDPKLEGANIHHRPGTGLTTGNINEAVIDSPSKNDPSVLFSILGNR